VLACTTVIIFFGLEETMYFRQTVEGVEEDSVEEKSLGADKDEKNPTPRIISPSPSSSTTQAQGYMQKLKLFRNLPGRPSVKQMFVMMYRPLMIFFYFPNITWAGFLYGSNLSWYLVVNGTMSSVLSAAPYNFATSMVGLAYVSPLLGSFAGALWAGWIGDRVALYLARRNGGMREPEHRLWILVASALIGAAGFLLWGVGAAYQINSVAIIVGTGMVMASVVVGGSVSLAYGVDCFKEISGEAMMLIIVIRNTIGFGFSYGITPWIDAQGYLKTFVAVGMLSLGCTLTFLIFTFFGKSLRRMSAKKYWEYVQTLVIPGGH
jgi:MFS family permease